MKEPWFISDTHLGHENIIQYCNRPFTCADEMDEYMVDQWNKCVGKYDRVYHMGDVAINRKKLSILERLNGKKVLLKGNHDIFPLEDYLPYFEDIRAYKIMPAHGIIFSHIPISEYQFSARFKWNVHGHTHEFRLPDERYFNACVEWTRYKPIRLGEILEQLQK